MATLIGFDMLHYATVTSDTAKQGNTAGATVYGTPKRVVGAVSADINPNTSDSTFFADDGPMETASALGKIELELSTANIPKEDQAILLGHKVDDKGIMVRSAGDTPPWVAIGGRALKSNGKYKYFWLLKGKMMVPEAKYQTKEENVEFQPSTIKGSFVKRDSDGGWQIECDEDDTDADSATIAAWFTNVPSVVFTPAAG